MRCTCPVCRATVEYPERYAHRWHRCRGGCAPALGTRLLIVPDAVGRTEDEVRGRRHADARRLRRRGLGLACAAALLVPAPVVGARLKLPVPRPLLLAVSGLAAAAAAAAAHHALTRTPRRPAGL